MTDVYYFWNAFNLISILTGTILIGLLLGGILSGLISLVTQIEDSSITFFGRLIGCLLGVYIAAPFILSSFKDFSLLIWGSTDIFK
ncbi:MAG TPA: flagellar biosynthetic protein FliQ [Oligoflexia bacterium]|nr:flagellar biosynthetic protein FliQ [Oligoflexia bacterium]HMP47628.1 flagellar biosynthetic protein FliQ [Oligoflexia bacterium]